MLRYFPRLDFQVVTWIIFSGLLLQWDYSQNKWSIFSRLTLLPTVLRGTSDTWASLREQVIKKENQEWTDKNGQSEAVTPYQ